MPIVDEIEETFLQFRRCRAAKLVTVIEVLSPTNKKTKDARAQYLDKRYELLMSKVNFVEIDLLRGGEPMPLDESTAVERLPNLDLSSRTMRPDCRSSRAFRYRTPIPTIPIPLLPDDAEPNLELNDILHALYERARYDLSIDYQQPPEPRLRKEDKSWAATILARAADSALRNPLETES